MRWVPLDRCGNVRDVGGYTTADFPTVELLSPEI